MEGVGGVFQGFQDLPSVKEILENEPVNKDHKLTCTEKSKLCLVEIYWIVSS